MHTFTREFRHPTDRINQVTPDAASRFELDDRRFPPGAYEEHSLLWHGTQWRTPTTGERCEMMGVPPDLLQPVAGSQARRVVEVFPDLLKADDVMEEPNADYNRAGCLGFNFSQLGQDRRGMSGSVWDLPSSFLVTGQPCRLGWEDSVMLVTASGGLITLCRLAWVKRSTW